MRVDLEHRHCRRQVAVAVVLHTDAKTAAGRGKINVRLEGLKWPSFDRLRSSQKFDLSAIEPAAGARQSGRVD